jgi:hypothetical protein
MEWPNDPKLYLYHLRPRIRAGKGLGSGTSYRPWIGIANFGSVGTCSEPPGIVVDRPYQLFSPGETVHFMLKERRPSTRDIQEQWPILDVESTLKLCRSLGIDHKEKDGLPEPYTIDLLVTEQRGDEVKRFACGVKPHPILGPSIAKLWCQNLGIDWEDVDSSAYSDTLLYNLRLIRTWFSDGYKPNAAECQRLARAFLRNHRRDRVLADLIRLSQRDGPVNAERVHNAFTYCCWRSLIPVDLQFLIAPDRPVVLLEPRCH